MTYQPTFGYQNNPKSFVPDESKWRQMYLSMTKDSRVYVARSVINSWRAHNNLSNLPNAAVCKIILSFIKNSFDTTNGWPDYLSGGCDREGSYLTLPIPGDVYGTSTAFLVFRNSDKENFDFSITTITGPSGAESMRLSISENFKLKNSNNPWILKDNFIILYRQHSDNEDDSTHYTAYTFLDGGINMTIKDLSGVLEDICEDVSVPDIQLHTLSN